MKNAMNKKIIKWFLILLILAFTVIFGIYIFNKNKSKPVSQPAQEIVEEKQVTDLAVEQPAEQPDVIIENRVYPTLVTGKLVGIGEDYWIINQPTGALQLKIDSKTVVFEKNGKNKSKIEAVSITPGTEMTVKINKSTGEVIEASIEE